MPPVDDLFAFPRQRLQLPLDVAAGVVTVVDELFTEAAALVQVGLSSVDLCFDALVDTHRRFDAAHVPTHNRKTTQHEDDESPPASTRVCNLLFERDLNLIIFNKSTF